MHIRNIFKIAKPRFSPDVHVKTPPAVQSLWIGNKLSVMEKVCISSFLQNGHSFHLYVYDDVEGIPEGVDIKDASTVISPNRIFKYKDHNSYAGFSNLFRYKLLLEKGGYWVDTDVICLKPFLDNTEYIFAAQRQKNGKTMATTCIIKAPIDSAIMEYCYSESADRDPEGLKWGQTGPDLLTRAITKFDMRRYVAKPEIFCPIDWWGWDQFLNGSSDKNVLDRAQAVHLWHEMWRRNKVDKSDDFAENCIYEQLKRIYLN